MFLLSNWVVGYQFTTEQVDRHVVIKRQLPNPARKLMNEKPRCDIGAVDRAARCA